MTSQKIAYHGIPGSFTYLAAKAHFPNIVSLHSRNRFGDIFKSVESKETEFGIVPLENSLAGSVYDNYDLLWQHDVKIVGEVYLRISHNLLAKSVSAVDNSSRLKQITKVYSHPKAIEQCEQFFKKYPNIEKCLSPDTASAAQMVASNPDSSIAAIASTQAAEEYGLVAICEHLEDNPSNFTRFVVLSLQEANHDGCNKCSIIFTLPHVPQSLIVALQAISSDFINITKIESRPIHGKPFEYAFYVDLEFVADQLESAKKVVKSFISKVNSCKVLGYYKKGHH